jgi:hypothetical protein
MKHAGIPISMSNQKMNSYLKEIGRMIPSLSAKFTRTMTKGGLTVSETKEKSELLTSHTARRSFATNEFLAGTEPLTIMAITGHKTEKSFYKYIKLSPRDHAKLLQFQWNERSRILKVV